MHDETPLTAAANALLEQHEQDHASDRTRRLPLAWRLFHGFVIVNLLFQVAYVGWQVFVVLQPEGTIGPMFGRAMSLPYELMMTRRMYAVEGWLAFIGLALYLGITEILPRRQP